MRKREVVNAQQQVKEGGCVLDIYLEMLVVKSYIIIIFKILNMQDVTSLSLSLIFSNLRNRLHLLNLFHYHFHHIYLQFHLLNVKVQ